VKNRPIANRPPHKEQESGGSSGPPLFLSREIRSSIPRDQAVREPLPIVQGGCAMIVISVEEFRGHVDEYLDATAKGEVVLTRDGKPVAVLKAF
jgi:hypothetical protein